MDDLIKALDPTHYKLNEPLSKYTTLKIGGPADILFQPTSTEELIAGVKKAKELNIPITMLGWGSNSLVSDKGIRGLVIKNASKNIKLLHAGKEIENFHENAEDATKEYARWDSATSEQGGRTMYDFKEINYDESEYPIVQIEVESGVDLPFLINHTIRNLKLTGLQWYGRIPGSIGGAVYNNIHGGTHFLVEIIDSVKVLDENNEVKILKHNELETGYDKSRFHNNKEIILSAVLNLRKGDPDKAWDAYQKWTRSKAVLQPPVSCGSVFQTIPNELKEKLGYPSGSAGYIIEHQLKMSGFHIGDAHIAKGHHNFIENKGAATAADYLAVIRQIQKRAREQLGIDLELEIFLLGEFD